MLGVRVKLHECRDTGNVDSNFPHKLNKHYFAITIYLLHNIEHMSVVTIVCSLLLVSGIGQFSLHCFSHMLGTNGRRLEQFRCTLNI